MPLSHLVGGFVLRHWRAYAASGLMLLGIALLVVWLLTLGVDWRLALVVLLPFPAMALSFWWISRHVHDASHQALDAFGHLNDHVQETLAGVRTLRALGLEARSSHRFGQLAKD